MKPVVRLGAAIAIGGLSIFGVAVGAASAAVDATCSAGDFCLWGEDAYTGCAYTNPNSRSTNLAVVWANCSANVENGANSARNRGLSCDVFFTDWNNLGGGYRIMSREASGGFWTDGDLGNNYWDGSVAYSSGTVIEDDTQSYKFCAP